jgi:hypothetical protein
MSDRIENITDRGARWRRRNGFVCLVVAAVALILLVATRAPAWYRMILALPIGIGAASFLQARERTCVALCALGKREPTRDRPDTTLTPAERQVLNRRSAWIVARSILIAIVAVAGAFFL